MTNTAKTIAELQKKADEVEELYCLRLRKLPDNPDIHVVEVHGDGGIMYQNLDVESVIYIYDELTKVLKIYVQDSVRKR